MGSFKHLHWMVNIQFDQRQLIPNMISLSEVKKGSLCFNEGGAPEMNAGGQSSSHPSIVVHLMPTKQCKIELSFDAHFFSHSSILFLLFPHTINLKNTRSRQSVRHLCFTSYDGTSATLGSETNSRAHASPQQNRSSSFQLKPLLNRTAQL